MIVMRLPAFIFITCSLLLAGACRRQNEASRELADYLAEKHCLEINDSTIYGFFPARQCRNCLLYKADYLVPEINEHTVIITGPDNSYFKGFAHVLHDSSNVLLRLQALNDSNRIITFKAGNISRNEVVKDLYAQLGNAWLNLP